MFSWLRSLFATRYREPYVDFQAQHNFRMGIWQLGFAEQIRRDAMLFKEGWPMRKIILDHADEVQRDAEAYLRGETPPRKLCGTLSLVPQKNGKAKLQFVDEPE